MAPFALLDIYIKSCNYLTYEKNVKNFLNDNPTIAKEIENQILQNAGIVEKAMMEGKVERKEKEKEVKEAEEIKE